MWYQNKCWINTCWLSLGVGALKICKKILESFLAIKIFSERKATKWARKMSGSRLKKKRAHGRSASVEKVASRLVPDPSKSQTSLDLLDCPALATAPLSTYWSQSLPSLRPLLYQANRSLSLRWVFQPVNIKSFNCESFRLVCFKYFTLSFMLIFICQVQ